VSSCIPAWLRPLTGAAALPNAATHRPSVESLGNLAAGRRANPFPLESWMGLYAHVERDLKLAQFALDSNAGRPCWAMLVPLARTCVCATKVQSSQVLRYARERHVE
jgi:hypothetical protein